MWTSFKLTLSYFTIFVPLLHVYKPQIPYGNPNGPSFVSFFRSVHRNEVWVLLLPIVKVSLVSLRIDRSLYVVETPTLYLIHFPFYPTSMSEDPRIRCVLLRRSKRWRYPSCLFFKSVVLRLRHLTSVRGTTPNSPSNSRGQLFALTFRGQLFSDRSRCRWTVFSVIYVWVGTSVFSSTWFDIRGNSLP